MPLISQNQVPLNYTVALTGRIKIKKHRRSQFSIQKIGKKNHHSPKLFEELLHVKRNERTNKLKTMKAKVRLAFLIARIGFTAC